MAKSRVTTNPMYTGGAGGYSFYVRKGEQVIRQRKNNSNYGDGASRTMAQMIRRIRWGNLVNVFKSQKAWQPKAYDSKTKGQTDYNIFMALNINQATVGFTKEMCEAGCAVIEGYQVSRGSLPPINLSASGSGSYYVTDIKLSITIGVTTTVGQLSSDIIANNPQFQEGDNIALVSFTNWLTSRTEWPYASSSYAEITLDSSSNVLVYQIPVFGTRLSKDSNGYLQVGWSSSGQFDPSREVGFVAIHTRKSASMLAVSSQVILMNSNSLVAQFSGAAWDNQCVLSYGLSDEVPLDPSFPEASITSVTANGSAILNAQVLTGSQEVHVLGTNIDASNVRFDVGGVSYYPLDVAEGDLTYLITANSFVRVFLGSRLIMSFTVEGITVPEGLPGTITAAQVPTVSPDTSQEGAANVTSVTDVVCQNYPYKATEALPYFAFLYRFAIQQEDIECFNCEVSGWTVTGGGNTRMNFTPVDADKPAWIELEGTIIAVFNYN